MNKREQWSLPTRLNHPENVTLFEGNRPILQPIYHSVKFTPAENMPYWDQFIYGRISNPTTRQLELTLADLQGREDCVVMASGIAALTGTFLSLLKAHDHVISFLELYKPARTFIREFLPRYQIESTILSLSHLDELEKAIIPGKTKLIHFESPTNPNLTIADIDFILSIARKHGVLVSMDGTFAGLHQHTEFDVDVMIHSLTKFGNGHGDVLAGSVAGKSEHIKKIREMSLYLGATMDSQVANLVTRGLKTYMLRYERQTKTASEVAQFLLTHPKVKNIKYPGLSNEKENQLAHKQMKHMGAVISFDIDPSVATSGAKFCHQLKLITLAASLGSTETIICPTEIFFGQDLSIKEKEELGISSFGVRLSIGLEESGDLINDLSEALG